MSKIKSFVFKNTNVIQQVFSKQFNDITIFNEYGLKQVFSDQI